MEFADVSKKLLLLLEKTRDSLIRDLEKQFAGVRQIVEDCEKSDISAATPFADIGKKLDSGYKVIDATFAQIGFDISHCQKTSELGKLITDTLALMDKLKDTITPLVKAKDLKSVDYSALGKAAMDCFKDIKALIEGYSNVSADKIISELQQAGEKFTDGFDIKDFVKKIVEHILITLLRNGQEVFADEIHYLKMQANAVYTDITDIADGVKKKVAATLNTIDSEIKNKANAAQLFAETLFDDSVREMKDVYNRLSAEARKDLDQVAKELEESGVKSIYEQVADGLAKAYAILDFLGVVGEKEVTLKLPKSFIAGLDAARSAVADNLSSALSTVKDLGSEVGGEIGGGLKEAKTLTEDAGKAISGTIAEKLKLTGDLVDASAFGITALQQQMAFISSNLSLVGQEAQNVGTKVNEAVAGLLKNAANFSYSLKITTFRWGRIERMFTSPVSYFKALYPVDTLEDAKNIIDKVLEIARLFNPDIPDFRSIRNLLESLLKTLGDKLMSLAGDAQSAFWKAVKPLMVTIRKVLDLLKELYNSLVKEATQLLTTLKDKIFALSEDGKSFLDGIADELEKLAKEITKGTTVPKSVQKLFDDIVAPAIVDAVSDSSAPDLEQKVANLKNTAQTEFKNWAGGVYTNLYNFFAPTVWKDRLDTVLGQLESVFNGDVAAVQGLLSGAMQTSLSGGWGKKLKDTFNELDVTQYIDVLSSALDDVSLPRPDLYFEGFVQCIDTILKSAEQTLNQYGISDVEDLAKDIASNVWNRIVNQIFNPLIRKIKSWLLRLVREAVKEILIQVLDLVRQIPNPLEDISQYLPSKKEALNGVSTALADFVQLKQNVDKNNRGGAASATLTLVKDTMSTVVPIDNKWLDWVYKIAERTITFCTSDMGYDKIFSLVSGLYSDLPDDVTEFVADMMPAWPDGDFKAFIKQCDYKADLDNDFVSLTVLKVDSEEAKKNKANAKKGDVSHAKVDFNATALLQFCFFALDEPVKKEGEDDKKKEGTGTGSQKSGSKTSGSKTTDGQTTGKTESEEEQETETVLYAVIIVNAGTCLTFPIGKNHTMSLDFEGSIGGKGVTGDVKKETLKALSNGCGLKLKKDWDFEFFGSTQALEAMFNMTFSRNEDNPWQVFDSKYLSMTIDNYPQHFYLGFAKNHPDLKKDYGVKSHDASDKNKFQVGYFGAIQNASMILKLKDVAFIKEVITDDVVLGFDTYLWYDYQHGFDFGGDIRLHLEYDLNHKKLGPLVIDSFSLDAGSVKGESGKLQLAVASTFQVDFGGALVVAIENLGIGFILNYKDEKGNYGDFDLDANLQYPSGFGLTVDASAVKGGGVISIDQETGEFFGCLELEIIKKIGVGGFVLCDPGTAEGHEFSLIVLLSARFSPGIPLGMGFSLTAIGGTLGLNRQISRDALQNGVRTGTLDQVFFVENIKDHLAEMKTNVITYFPAKHGQFFFGVLGQISYEPVVKCDFGLLLQVPKPTEIIIVGALRVNAAEGIVKINVFFAGGINFEEGMWFDASIVDSQIVGISISGDMAFRLNWGGTKGFLLSIGGFHPAYKPEEGLHVGKMNRLAMKLDYSILKLSFETYMAITSNSFQIGARFDLKVGWDKFGIVGYAGFDALFQFDPFLFMFYVCAGVSVKCGSWNLLSIDLSLDVQGPAPWKIAGKAKFNFLFIPIDVSFSKTWGKKAPELPSKLVKVIPLFEEEWGKKTNWVIENPDPSGKPLVAFFDAPEGVMLAQPDGSVTFNQSAVPMKTEASDTQKTEELLKMDVCNDAVPEDYNSIRITKVNDKDVVTTQNDFAPSLYKAMSIDEKLKSDSYVKYDSGFTMNLRDSFAAEDKGKNTFLGKEPEYHWRTVDGAEKHGSDIQTVSRFSAGEEKISFSVNKAMEILKDVYKANINKPADINIDINKPVDINIDINKPVDLHRPNTFDPNKPIEEVFKPEIVVDPNQFQPNRPIDPVITVKHVYVPQAVSNNRRDRAAFDRYIAVLEKKQRKMKNK